MFTVVSSPYLSSLDANPSILSFNHFSLVRLVSCLGCFIALWTFVSTKPLLALFLQSPLVTAPHSMWTLCSVLKCHGALHLTGFPQAMMFSVLQMPICCQLPLDVIYASSKLLMTVFWHSLSLCELSRGSCFCQKCLRCSSVLLKCFSPLWPRRAFIDLFLHPNTWSLRARIVNQAGWKASLAAVCRHTGWINKWEEVYLALKIFSPHFIPFHFTQQLSLN